MALVEEAKLFLITVGVFFLFYINTVHGIRSINPRLIEMGRGYVLGPSVVFERDPVGCATFGPGWPPVRAGHCVADTDRGGNYRVDNGIGFMTMNARDFLQTDVVLLGINLYALLGKVAEW